MDQQPKTPLQKGLLAVLYALIVLMIVFSLLSLRNLGEDGYRRCIEKRCAAVGQEQCQKLREVNNCCLGAGGEVGIADNRYLCRFED